ncbi:uncharacterized protein LOC118746357 [Rhagoletis pomonella]|uniref:uncharacterized protein LOC118746357 n=1 Tax=Rhagoletis pomonella TaxID=28610 RepID=UPI0017846C3F|nr:uncharacterized protein LOC118746357 [Rhagoletis pomonella]
MAELRLRAPAIKAIKRIYERVQASKLGSYDEFQLEQELKLVSSHFARFVANHELLVASAEKGEVEAHETLWVEVEDIYNDTCCILNRAITGAKPNVQAGRQHSHECEFRLEPLAIPTFDGTMQTWLAFKDAFELLVHNTEYPEAYKLGKLRQAVSSHAVPLVGSVYSGGYGEVWSALKERFDNKKQLAETHVSRLLNIKPSSEDSSESLLAIFDTVQESLRSLRVIGLPVVEWDAILVPIIVSKLPTVTQREWNMSCLPTEIPKLDELLSFLSQRAHSLSTAIVTWSSRTDATSRGQQRTSSQRTVKSHVAAAEDGKCAYCQGPHRTTKCTRFLAMNHEERVNALKAARLCFNCLKLGHSAKQCPSGLCRHCNRKHNSLLCRETLSTNAGGLTATTTQPVPMNKDHPSD